MAFCGLTVIDCENWLAPGRTRLVGPRRPPRLLLPGAGPQGSGLFIDIPALQGMRSSALTLNTKTHSCIDQAHLSLSLPHGGTVALLLPTAHSHGVVAQPRLDVE